jgi:hypothetical protein
VTSARATPTASRTATRTSSSATATPTLDQWSQCPGANNTVYTSSTSSKNFTIHCDLDYSGGDEAKDLTNNKQPSMDSCLDECAQTSQCQGAGWGLISGNYTCYLKTNLTIGHVASGNWMFGILDS